MAAKKSFDSSVLKTGADGAMGAVSEADDPEALVRAWVDAGNVVAVATVADEAKGVVRKAARRGLNVLKSRGIEAPKQKKVGGIGKKATREVEAWMLAPDAAGNVMLVIGEREPAGRYDTCFVVLHDGFGVHKVEVGVMSQSKLRESFARAMPSANYKPVTVPVNWARARIAQARAKHAERGTVEPMGFGAASALLEPVPQEQPPHPLDAEKLEIDEKAARERTERSAELHVLPEFQGWYPTQPAVEEMMLEVGRGLTPGEEPPPDEIEKRLREQVDAATDRYFSPQLREGLLRSMTDSTLSVLRRDGREKALDVVATMKIVEQAGLITDPPREIPFLRAFFEKAVSLMLAQGKGQLRVPIPMDSMVEPPPPQGPVVDLSGSSENDSAGDPAPAEE